MYDEQKFKRRIVSIVEEKGYGSVMNDTKWRELQSAMQALPFPPPYQIKDIHSDKPCPAEFSKDVWYLGNWEDECLMPFFQIEWVCVRPRYIKQLGRLIGKKVFDETQEFLSVLKQYSIPYEEDGFGGFMIYGYR